MPDKDGVLTQEEMQRAQEHLRKKVPKLRCPACGEQNFSVAEHLLSPQLFFKGGALILGGSVAYPQLQLNCKNCSYTLLFSAVGMGVIAAQDEEREQVYLESEDG